MAKEPSKKTSATAKRQSSPKDAEGSADASAAKFEQADVAALSPEAREKAMAEARAHVAGRGRNEPCHCGSGKKYKKCHLGADEAMSLAPKQAPTAKELLANAWGLFEQRRPGAAEKEFRAALALDAELVDARVGIGMARLSANDVENARTELSAVVTAASGEFDKLRSENVTDAFTRPEAQPIIRAAHALGCLAYDQERFADAYTDLERVFSVDKGAVGTEARLIAAKALMKENKPTEAIAVLEPATASETGASRAHLGLALAHRVAGNQDAAETSLKTALQANPHFAKVLLGRVRRRVENLAGSQPGSIEEALVYAQTYGDVWTDDAKKLLTDAVDGGTASSAAQRTEPAAETAAAVPAAG